MDQILEQLKATKKATIITNLAKKNTIINKMERFRLNQTDKEDLEQMILLYLLEMDLDYFIDLVDRKKLDSYINRMLVLQYKSSTSRFYKEIIKFQLTTSPIEDYNECY